MDEVEELKADLLDLWGAVFSGAEHLDFMYPPSKPHLTAVRLKPECKGNNKAMGLVFLLRKAQKLTEKYPHLMEAAKKAEAEKADA